MEKGVAPHQCEEHHGGDDAGRRQRFDGDRRDRRAADEQAASEAIIELVASKFGEAVSGVNGVNGAELSRSIMSFTLHGCPFPGVSRSVKARLMSHATLEVSHLVIAPTSGR
jgi:hypothetical protein